MKTQVKKIILKGEEKVYVEYSQATVLKGGIVIPKDRKETVKKGPHADLSRCLDKMVPHILFSLGIVKPEVFDPSWFADFKFYDDPFHMNIVCTGVEILGKDQDAIQITGVITNDQHQEVEIKSAKISLLDDGENKYVLLDIIRDNTRDLLIEVDEFIENKKYLGSNQVELRFEKQG